MRCSIYRFVDRSMSRRQVLCKDGQWRHERAKSARTYASFAGAWRFIRQHPDLVPARNRHVSRSHS
jgi:hypothetical protein